MITFKDSTPTKPAVRLQDFTLADQVLIRRFAETIGFAKWKVEDSTTPSPKTAGDDEPIDKPAADQQSVSDQRATANDATTTFPTDHPLVELLRSVPDGATIHAFEREQFPVGAEPLGFQPDARINAIIAQLPEEVRRRFNWKLPNTQRPLVTATAPDTIYDLIWVDPANLMLAKHDAGAIDADWVGNQVRLALPENAPSRAWLKFEEAIQRYLTQPWPTGRRPSAGKSSSGPNHDRIRELINLATKQGEQNSLAGLNVLELGCSPGGATLNMLRRGMHVVGVDPLPPDQSVLKFASHGSGHKKSRRSEAPTTPRQEPAFRWLAKPTVRLNETDLASCNPDWLVSDMSIAPLEAIDQLRHVMRTLIELHGSNLNLKLALLTIKLNDWKFAQSLELYLKRISELGWQIAVANQLTSNRQEFFVLAVRESSRRPV